MLKGSNRAVLGMKVTGMEEGCGRDRAYGGHVFSGVPLVKPSSNHGREFGIYTRMRGYREVIWRYNSKNGKVGICWGLKGKDGGKRSGGAGWGSGGRTAARMGGRSNGNR